MPTRFRLDLAYEGSGFAGWQVQPQKRTVQGELAGIFSRLGENDARPTGAGRTDVGVHALGQVAHVDLMREWAEAELATAIRQLAPGDISLLYIKKVPQNFHSRYEAASRTYLYSLGVEHNPFFQNRRWVVGTLPDRDWILGELDSVLGEHDFAALAKSGGGSPSTRCRVLTAEWIEFSRGAVLSITATRFLYGMVRALVGTLVRGFETGTQSGLQRILATKDRSHAGMAAPPGGLYLATVWYRGEPDPGSKAGVVASISNLEEPRSEERNNGGSDG